MSKQYPKVDTSNRRTSARPIFLTSKYVMHNNGEPNGVGTWVFRDGDHREFSFTGNYGKARQAAEAHFPDACFIFLSIKSTKKK